MKRTKLLLDAAKMYVELAMSNLRYTEENDQVHEDLDKALEAISWAGSYINIEEMLGRHDFEVLDTDYDDEESEE